MIKLCIFDSSTTKKHNAMITSTKTRANETFGIVTEIMFSNKDAVKNFLKNKNFTSLYWKRARTPLGWTEYVSVTFKQYSGNVVPSHFVLIYGHAPKDAGWIYHEEQGISMKEII